MERVNLATAPLLTLRQFSTSPLVPVQPTSELLVRRRQARLEVFEFLLPALQADSSIIPVVVFTTQTIPTIPTVRIIGDRVDLLL